MKIKPNCYYCFHLKVVPQSKYCRCDLQLLPKTFNVIDENNLTFQRAEDCNFFEGEKT
jgi:hypothetical protein